MIAVTVVCDDLLLGSNLVGVLNAAGHEARMVADPAQASGAVIVVAFDGSPAQLALGAGATPAIAVYSHVDTDAKAAAEAAGFDLVVPRSRFMREGALLVTSVARGH